jgi:voltage-gated potassium channel Kch
MFRTIYLFIVSGIVILLGTMIMYDLESGVKDTQIQTPLDALWWCIATVTTVGYGDIVPITNIGRIVAMIYMFFGITLITILLSVITNNFYKKRIGREERQQKEKEVEYLKNLLLNKLSDIEKKQSECIEAINQFRLSMESTPT